MSAIVVTTTALHLIENKTMLETTVLSNVMLESLVVHNWLIVRTGSAKLDGGN